ncbi:MAG TPA: acyl-[ACP]--phospholipid O-acyltransferase [Candidatus Acidoferrum sp.]|nr:acyl-[ACP]--phospholipid O-acyltransferase [Candidatus Acidoferrum sp.]
MPDEGRRWRLGFWSLIVTQFQGAFNENGLKYFVIYLILSLHLGSQQEDKLIFLIGVLFAAPFILFSMFGGFLADKFSKGKVTIGTKYFEIVVVAFSVVVLLRFHEHPQSSIPLLLAAIFLASSQAAIFGPSKYGLLPELLPEAKLSWGNGVIELGTFLAIILGTIAGSRLPEFFPGHEVNGAYVFLGCGIAGLLTAHFISRVPAADPAKEFRLNVFGDLFSHLRTARADRALWLAIVGNTYFWFLGALLQFNVVLYGERVLHVPGSESAKLQAAIAIGIGIGSFVAGSLSGGRIEYGLVPLGALGMTLFGFLLSAPQISFLHILILLAALGFSGGFFIVPVSALIQHRPDEKDKGGVIASANLLSFVGVAAAAAVPTVFSDYLHLGPRAVFLWASIGTLAATAYLVFLLPDSLLRLVLWLATHTIYRIHTKGVENVPARGGAMLCPNHSSMVDGVLLIASTDRPIRFLMFKGSYEHWLVKPFAKIMGVIPIASNQGPRELIHSLRAATEALKNGELLCIFPEGQMTRIGQMLPFRRGLERIMKGVEAPIIPVHIDGVWGSIFSFAGGKFLWKFPRKIPYPVHVTFGAPLAGSTGAQEVRRHVQELGVDAFADRKDRLQTVSRAFIHTARRHPFRFAMADGRTPRMSYFSALTKAVFLARRLRKHWKDQAMVGLFLPPSIPGALVNFAAMLMGKVPVNLNYTVSREALESCAKQCELKTTVTSKLFLEKVKVQAPGEALYAEDLVANPGFLEKLAALLGALLLPTGMLQKFCGAARKTTLDDTATVIFSSGSTGEPKGVVLSHYNLASNVAQLMQVFILHKTDRILGILPFFHSFGFTGTLCLPAASGIGAVFHPSPLDSRAIGALVSQHSVTMLLATPTFLNAYTRRCTAEDFGSLRIVMAGAEKLPERISIAFEDQFGIRPLEGYGCTECSPVVAVNTLDFRAAQFRQVGAKRGTIGHPLPGIAIRIVDPETGELRGAGESGLLLVRGPNIMRGYLHRPEKTAEVLKDGWYNTGDIATVDEDGFLRITDRLSRFSKIGGEMVPHIKVEEKLQEIAQAAEQVFAVTAVPDEKKGERLIVLTTLSEENLAATLEGFSKADLPALWKPRADNFVRIEALPYLGTGKLDLRRLRELALEMTGTSK